MKPQRNVIKIWYTIDVERAPHCFDCTAPIYDPLEAMKTYQDRKKFYGEQGKKVYITEVTEIAETRTLSLKQLKQVATQK